MIVSLWVLTAAYVAHIMEEHSLNWKEWAASLSGVHLQWSEFFLANGAVLVLGVSCASVGVFQPWFAFLFPGLALANALVAHIGTSLVTKKYSPGLLTAIFLFLPISGWAYYEAFMLGLLTIPFAAFTILGGLLIMGVPVFIQLFKKKMESSKGSSEN